jgi:hypothetical protein
VFHFLSGGNQLSAGIGMLGLVACMGAMTVRAIVFGGDKMYVNLPLLEWLLRTLRRLRPGKRQGS